MPSKNSLGQAKKALEQALHNIESTTPDEEVKDKKSFLSAVSGTISQVNRYVKKRKREKQEEIENAKMPSWKHRRRFIYMTFILGVGMILFGAFTYMTDTQVGAQLVIGGVALISIIVTAYTGFAAFEDVRLWNQYERITPVRFGEDNPHSETPTGVDDTELRD
jgi:hypothetical protein